MDQQLSLNGSDWLFKDFYGEDWLWRGSHKPGTRDVLGWRQGAVPGSVIHDVWHAGDIPDPYFERNSLQAEWIPARTWVYKKSFQVGEQYRGACIRLHFSGVDYAARFYLNGLLLGEHTGMYTPVDFEIGDLLDYSGENLLAVVIEAAPHEEPQVGRTSRVRTNKARMNYWWDFCPRFVHQGIWDEVWLQMSGPVRVEDVYTQPHLSLGPEQADVAVQTELAALAPTSVRVDVAVWLDASLVASATGEQALPEGRSTVRTTLSIPNPRLWWPNGCGEQPIYRAEVTVWYAAGQEQAGGTQDLAGTVRDGGAGSSAAAFSLPQGEEDVLPVAPDLLGTFSFPTEDEQSSRAAEAPAPEPAAPPAPPAVPFSLGSKANGRLLLSDRRSVNFGIRSLELVRNDTPDTTALPYTFVVNGRRIYANGWNWAPIDALYGVERPQKLAHLLELAVQAHVNLLRVWGGGLIEKESFYDLCDRRGILVWQEFTLSSSGIDNEPSSDPAYLQMLASDAEQIVPGRRNHPSLALWCGGNELQDGPDRPLTDERSPALASLHEIVARLDPGRAWLPTSPSGRFFGNDLKNIAQDPLGLHDVHGPWEYQGLTGQYTLYNQGTSLLHSEFGVEGLTNLRTLERSIAPEHRWPVTRANRFYLHSAAWWLREGTLRDAFGDLPDLASTVRAGQFLQFEGLRYAVEADRRRQWRNSGTLPWQFDEPFPNAACTSAVDYFGRPKPAYYAVRGAYTPLAVSARFDTQAWAGQASFRAEAWACNAGLAPSTGTLAMRIVGASGAEYVRHELPITVPANGAAFLAAIDLPLAAVADELFFLDLALMNTDNMPSANNRYLFSRTADLKPMLAAQATQLSADVAANADSWQLQVSNSGTHAALGAWLEDDRPVEAGGYVYFDANYFHLLPGETRRVTVLWQNVAADERRLALAGWNTPTYLLTKDR